MLGVFFWFCFMFCMVGLVVWVEIVMVNVMSGKYFMFMLFFLSCDWLSGMCSSVVCKWDCIGWVWFWLFWNKLLMCLLNGGLDVVYVVVVWYVLCMVWCYVWCGWCVVWLWCGEVMVVVGGMYVYVVLWFFIEWWSGMVIGWFCCMSIMMINFCLLNC